MTSKEYIRPLNNADFVFHITQLGPLILWGWFGLQLSKHLVKSGSTIGKKIARTISFPLEFLHVIVFVLWLIPIAISVRTLYYSSFIGDKDQYFKFDPKTPSLPPGFGYCMDSKVKKKDADKGVVAYWDYKCEGDNEKLISSGGTGLLQRFYYVNYAIFLILILVFNALDKFNILNNKFILLNTRFALMLGTIGCILPVFGEGFYLRSLWMTQTWSTFLSMNGVCFVFIGLSIMSYSRAWSKININWSE
jgi:hypothetical protein